MIINVNLQIYYFLSTVIAGIAVGIMFDIYRVIIGFNNPSRILTAISDVLFWLLCSCTVFVFFLYTNNGDLRYYTFVGLALGIIFYFKIISKRFIIILRSITYGIMKCARILVILILYPIKYILYLIKFILYKVKSLIKGIAKKTQKESAIEKKERNLWKRKKCFFGCC